MAIFVKMQCEFWVMNELKFADKAETELLKLKKAEH